MALEKGAWQLTSLEKGAWQSAYVAPIPPVPPTPVPTPTVRPLRESRVSIRMGLSIGSLIFAVIEKTASYAHTCTLLYKGEL